MSSSEFDRLTEELVVGNRILARYGVVDAFGHISFRHPDQPDRYVMARSLSPQLVTADDLLTFSLEGEEIHGDARRPYGERFIHGAIYEARSDVQVVCHNHSPSIIPFGVTDVPLRPVYHVAGLIGANVPVWDIAHDFGPTDYLVTNMAMGRSLARVLASGRVALMAGHGSVIAGKTVPEVVSTGVYMEENARLQTTALLIGAGKVRYLSSDEVQLCGDMMQRPLSAERAWQYWRIQAGFPPEP